MLESLSRETGGLIFRHTNDLAGVMEKIEAGTASYYLLAYSAPAERRGKYHEIDVDVLRAGVKLSHRRGYYEDKPFDRYTALEKEIQVASVVASAKSPDGVDATTRCIQFPPCPSSQNDGSRKTGRCLVALEIASAMFEKLSLDICPDLEVFSFAVDYESGEIRGYCHSMARVKSAAGSAGFRYIDLMDLVPGNYEIRTVARNMKTGVCAVGVSRFAMTAQSGFALAAAFISPKSTWDNQISERSRPCPRPAEGEN